MFSVVCIIIVFNLSFKNAVLLEKRYWNDSNILLLLSKALPFVIVNSCFVLTTAVRVYKVLLTIIMFIPQTQN